MPLDPDARPFTSMLSLLAPSDADPAAQAGGGVPGLLRRLIVLTSPSKCFNVAPLDLAVAIVPDDSLRRRFRNAGKDSAEVGCFAYAAAAAAYGDDESEAWRQRLVAYLLRSEVNNFE